MNEKNNTNPYDDSRPFNTYKWSNEPFLSELTDEVWDRIKGSDKLSDGDKRKIRKYNVLQIVIADLFMLWREKDFQYISISLNRNNYVRTNRYNDDTITYTPLNFVITCLREQNLIEFKIGYSFENNSRNSRIRPSVELIDLFSDYSSEQAKVVYDPNVETIILKAFKKNKEKKAKKINYTETDDTFTMRRALGKYNKLIHNTTICLSDDAEKEYPKHINYNQKTSKRNFTDESFQLGGRFYGGWWVNAKSDFRKHIKINGANTVEIDYSAMHIVLLYSWINIDYFEDLTQDCFLVEDKNDPYSIDGFENTKEHRVFFKVVLLICINTKSQSSAIRAVKDQLRKKKLVLPKGLNNKNGVKVAIEAFERKHSKISQFFYSEKGKELQFFDSIIADGIIEEFTDREIPLLSIHDSFICDVKYESMLTEYLVNGIRWFLNEPRWTVKLKK